jgi:hypothetical protein
MEGSGYTLEPAKRLTKDIKAAAKTLSTAEARYLVDTYYQLQRDRIRSDNQVRSLEQVEEPHLTLSWLSENSGLLERNVKSALDSYGDAHLVEGSALGVISRSRSSASGALGLLGQRRKSVTLCWKLGESFVKVSGHERDVYGKLYLRRKAYELERNDAGLLSAQAAEKLARFRIGHDTEARKAYESGKLPPAHLHARAKRWTVKLFLAHFHQVAYRDRHGTMPPKPYVISQLQHGHEIVCPNWPF